MHGRKAARLVAMAVPAGRGARGVDVHRGGYSVTAAPLRSCRGVLQSTAHARAKAFSTSFVAVARTMRSLRQGQTRSKLSWRSCRRSAKAMRLWGSDGTLYLSTPSRQLLQGLDSSLSNLPNVC